MPPAANPVPALFRHIEKLHAGRPWGDVLDAGTGIKSLTWLTGLASQRVSAVTASQAMATKLQAGLDGRWRPQDRLIVGNWTDEALLAGQRFDVVLMDYLIGAIDGFAPYWQDRIFARLRRHVAARVYIVGLEPYVPYEGVTEAARLVREIGCLRDACLLLAGERPYREFPLDWTLRQLQRDGFRVIAAQHFPIRYRARFVNGQLDMCLARLPRFQDPTLAQAMRGRIQALREHALALAEAPDGLRAGADYVIAAELA
ncbi:MAG: class I SAM-dependent methyltransferase [Sphingomonadales bacterium]